MVARVVSLKGSMFPPLWDVGRLELVKWLAFAAMVADHVDLILFGRGVPWLHAIGAFAFPAFCLTFGLGLARSSQPLHVAMRLVWPAAFAQLAWMFFHDHPANVLFVFTFCAIAAAVRPLGQALHVSAWLAVVALAAWHGEGGALGPALVGAGFFSGRQFTRVHVSVFGAGWALLVSKVGAWLALAAVLAWPGWAPRAPRRPGLLAWAYAAHLGMLVGLAALP